MLYYSDLVGLQIFIRRTVYFYLRYIQVHPKTINRPIFGWRIIGGFASHIGIPFGWFIPINISY